jgi:hypothetical protein
LTMASYDPVTSLPNGTTMCLGVRDASGVTRQWYNLDCWNYNIPKGVTVPITVQPPAATPLPAIVVLACPVGCQVTLTTVAAG